MPPYLSPAGRTRSSAAAISALVLLLTQAPLAAQSYDPGLEFYKQKQYDQAVSALRDALALNRNDVHIGQTYLGASYVKILQGQEHSDEDRLALLGKAYAAFRAARACNVESYAPVIEKGLREHVCGAYGRLLYDCGRAGGCSTPDGLSALTWAEDSKTKARYLAPATAGAPAVSRAELYRHAYEVLTLLSDLGGDVSLLRLESNPPQAEVTIGGLAYPELLTPCDLALLIEPDKPEAAVQISRERYQPAPRQVSLRKGKLPTVPFELKLQPATLTVKGPVGTWTVEGVAGEQAMGAKLEVPLPAEQGETRKVIVSAAGYEPQEFAANLVPGSDESREVILKLSDARVTVTTTPAVPAAKVFLRGAAEEGPYQPGQEVAVPLTAPELKVQLEVVADGYVTEGGVQTLTLRPGANPAATVTLTRQPGWLLPFAVTCDSVMQAGSAAPVAVPAGARELPWLKLTASTPIALADTAGLVYYRGQLREQGKRRSVADAPGFLTGGFSLSGPLDGVTDLRLEPAQVPAPSPVVTMTAPGQWPKLPVGTYRLSGRLSLPGLRPLDLRRETVEVGEGKATAPLVELVLPLLPQLGEQVVRHNLSVAVEGRRTVDGQPQQGAALAGAQVRLVPKTRAVAEAGKRLALLGVPQARIALPDAVVSAATADAGGAAVFESLPDGEYELTVLSEGKVAAGPVTATVPAAGAARLTVDSYFASLDIRPEAGWTVLLDGAEVTSAITGDLLQLPGAREGALVIRSGDTEIWRAVLRGGRLQEAQVIGGDFEVRGLPAGLRGRLAAVAGKVPLAARWSEGEPRAAQEGALRWASAPAGTYRVEIDGFRPEEVQIPQLSSLDAKNLQPQICRLSIGFKPPLTADTVRLTLKASDEQPAPYFLLHPADQYKLDPAALPSGRYKLSALWQTASRLCEKALDLAGDTAVELTEADFTTAALMPLEVAVKAQYAGYNTVDGVQVAGSAPVPANHPGTLELIAADGTRLALTRLKDRQVFAASVPPGKYRLVYTAPTLDRREAPGKQQACATRDGVLLTVDVPLQVGAKQVVTAKCDLTPGKALYELELIQSGAPTAR